MDEGNLCLLGLLDLSAAFDTVDNNILIARLNSTFGISGAVLDWFRSYLNDRKQFVNLSGGKSRLSDVRCGIPQGSILGPLLFILYTSPVTDITRYVIKKCPSRRKTGTGNELVRLPMVDLWGVGQLHYGSILYRLAATHGSGPVWPWPSVNGSGHA